LHQNRIGKDAANGILPPFAVFYPTLVRGYGWNNLYMLEQGESGFNTDDLLGSKMLVGNLEIRIPFTGPERLTPIKSKFLFSELTLFLDGGLAWGNWNNENQFEQSVFSQSSSFGKRKPIFSTGVALRVNVFNAMILEPFYAIPLQGKGMSRGSFGLNFTPGW
jgi:outer membrane protein assembly factor BamA